MYQLSDNYHHRKCYLKRNQVPTQSVMKKKMTEPLANIFFNSMTKKQKVLVGLEPPMTGGGSEWYIPPEELLAGRAVLKPVAAKVLKKLTTQSIWKLGDQVKNDRFLKMKDEIQEQIAASDSAWKKTIYDSNKHHEEERNKFEGMYNSQQLLLTIEDFETLYRTSVTKIEETICMASQKEIERIREEAYQHMKQRLAQQLESQSVELYKKYEDKLNDTKNELKKEFIAKVKEIRCAAAYQIHVSNYEKHIAIEKLRHFLQCQNLACQVYVALKEKEECERELELSERHHKKVVNVLKGDIMLKDYDIKQEKEKQAKHQEFIDIWRKKICHVVKQFQAFVEYCLRQVPEYAEFFINVEKLMLLQLSEAYENPNLESNIIKIENKPKDSDPEPRPRPFHLFCDKGYKPNIDRDLCPKRGTSDDSQFPVIVIGKRCIYSACDNLELFIDKVAQYVYKIRGDNDDDDVIDDENYEVKVPVKYSSLTQLLELKLESSLMQVLQNELPNSRDLPLNCKFCKIPFCFCTQMHLGKSVHNSEIIEKPMSLKTIKPMTTERELQLRREPKWDSYADFVATKRCKCVKTAKKQLYDHLPAYMRNMSPYTPPELPNYEICDLETIRRLVKKANNIPETQDRQTSKSPTTKDAFTQYSDEAFEALCTCFSDDEMAKFFKNIMGNLKPFSREAEFEVVDAGISRTVTKSTSSFATARAHSLRYLLDDDGDLKEIFKRTNCD